LQLIAAINHATTTIVIPEQSTGLTPDVVVEYFRLGDYESVTHEAFLVGRQGSIFQRAKEQIVAVLNKENFEFPVIVRVPAIESLLNRELNSLLKHPQDAHFERDGSEFVIISEISGEKIDLASVIPKVAEALLALKTNRFQLRVQEWPAMVRTNDIEPLADFVSQIGDHLTLALEYPEGKAYVSGPTLATWITVKPGAEPVLSVQRNKVEEFVRQTINERISDQPQNSRFEIRDNKIVETVPGTAGSVAEISLLISQLENELNRRHQLVLKDEIIRLPIIFTEGQPKITTKTIARYNVTELVGSATTSFKGSSASRRHNIAIGAERTSGVLIAPGQEFSLVDAIGEVSEEEGFEKEYVIKGDRSVKEAGGGLCQLATTVFRAVLNAGLPITERQNHSYVVGYYGPGLDATIYGPHPDLKFVNDTGKYLLFQMRVSGDDLIAEFYGTKDGRTVAVSEPTLSKYKDPPPPRYIPAPDKPWGAMECVDKPRRGLTASATYSVTYADGTVQEQVFKSVYQPWPKICLVGIKY